MAYPDIVTLLRTYLLPIVSVPISSRVRDPRPAHWLQVRRVGGTQQRPVRDQPRVDVLAWHDTNEDAAWQLADLARRSIHALQATTTLGPVVYRVTETLGPTSSDDPLTGAIRYLATYSISIRADDAIAR